MALIPRTLHAAACDECGRIFQDSETDTDALFHPDHPDTLRWALEAEDWLVGHRILCPGHAQTAADQALHALEIDATHEPLFPATPSPPNRAGPRATGLRQRPGEVT